MKISDKEVRYLGSPLARYQLSDQSKTLLLKLTDELLHRWAKGGSLDASRKLASAVNKEVTIPLDLVPEVKRELLDIALDYHRDFYNETELEGLELTINSAWCVSQAEAEWNYLHSHSGDLSAVLYLKMPSDLCEGLALDDKRRQFAGGITFADGGSSYYRKSLISLVPKVGEIYVFPSSLLHTVYPFFSNEERRSLSFNVTLKKKK